ncbi:AbrB family transcriptional regulator [Acuticoccus sp. I52.16.1]|uniref:AbrB family transcriptional regulator n=1 Tax=Acuticoccus sp. I52.16.1 TaxID=2928472 RepID=UPI001FD12097|nr:AbrB family transcriptional regulator [Acuticoccus sp. I52.16.1]UOM32693.1 AbrB family transcriptional regulator [Acuticoccus sp. I52.16.1]
MLRGLIVALVPALAGAGACVALGVPAGALIGSTLAVTAVALARLGPRVPQTLRDTAFATIGVTLGSGVTPHLLSDLARFPLSLAALTVTIVVVMALSGMVLRRGFGLDRATSILATSPGAMSYALSLAVGGGRAKPDTQTVMTLQSLRLLLITVLLPPLIAQIDATTGTPHPAVAALPILSLVPSVVLIAAAFVVGIGFGRLHVPAAFLLAGVVTSGLAHGAGLLEGRPSNILTFVGFSLAGAVIGERFDRLDRTALKHLIVAGLVTTGIAVGVSGLASAGVAHLLALPFGQVWVSFAPGGVEGMGAMALALGYDPVYVATHHIYRLLLLIALLPILLRRI